MPRGKYSGNGQHTKSAKWKKARRKWLKARKAAASAGPQWPVSHWYLSPEGLHIIVYKSGFAGGIDPHLSAR